MKNRELKKEKKEHDYIYSYYRSVGGERSGESVAAAKGAKQGCCGHGEEKRRGMNEFVREVKRE